MPRMKTSLRALDMKDHHIGGQQVIEAPFDRFRAVFHRRRDSHVYDLSESMNPGVGSPGPLHLDVAPENLARCFPHFAHHSPGIRLFLPAAVSRAVVFK